MIQALNIAASSMPNADNEPECPYAPDTPASVLWHNMTGRREDAARDEERAAELKAKAVKLRDEAAKLRREAEMFEAALEVLSAK